MNIFSFIVRFLNALAWIRALFSDTHIRQEQKNEDRLDFTTGELHAKEREAQILAGPELSKFDNSKRLRELRDS